MGGWQEGYMHVIAGGCGVQKRVSDPPRVGVTDGCGPPNASAPNQTRLLQEWYTFSPAKLPCQAPKQEIFIRHVPYSLWVINKTSLQMI